MECNKFISITLGREAWNADSSHEKFKEALQCIINDDIVGALALINIEKAVTSYTEGNIHIEDGELYFKGYNLKNGLTKRIINSMHDKLDFKFYLPFLENLMQNPSNKAVNRLFDFLEANDIEITDDGYFYAWKKVNNDYTDIFTATMDNSVGSTPTVDRNQVDEDDQQTCSHGLHVCSKSYLKSYASGNGSDRIVKCKVHPKDVVAIPYDYKNAKMRTCSYEVVEDVTDTI